jgi:ABC-type nitrate/sulfonate/bicarbonate transport system substrate-binding protein
MQTRPRTDYGLFRVVGALVGVIAFALATTAAAATPQDVTIGLSSATFGTAAARIAKEMGIFAAHGLEPKFIVMDNSSVATTAVISGSLKFALSGPGDLVVAQARGQKVVVVANTFAGASATLVLRKNLAEKLSVAPDAPIMTRLKALDGLVIATTSASGATSVTFRTAAKAAGAALRFAYMAQPAMPAALENGAIDGYVASAPIWASSILRGAGVLWISGPRGDLPAEFIPASSGHLQAMRGYAEANPDLMKSLVAVFDDFARAVEARPAEVKAVVAKLFPDLDGPTIELLYGSESRAWRVKPPTLAEMVHEIAFVKASGTPLPDIDKIDPATMLFP